jgi:Ca2+-binding RTX toxin-like protein
MTTTPTIWKSGFRVASDTTFFNQLRPQTIGLADGRFLTLWWESNFTDGDGIYAKFFTAEGQSAGRFKVATAGDASAAALPAGGFVIVQPSSDGAAVERYDATGQLVFADVIAGARDSKVTVDAAGNYTVLFERDLDPAPFSVIADVHAITYGAFTNARGAEQTQTAQNTSEHDNLVAAATFSNGHIITLAEDFDGSTLGGQFSTTEITITDPATGAVTRATIELDGSGLKDAVPQDVALLTGGQFVVIYAEWDTNLSSDTNYRLWMRIGASELGTIGGRIQIGATTENFLTDASVVALKDGGFFVAWIDADLHRLFGQRYDAAGVAIGERMFISIDVYALSELSLTSDGRILIAYEGASQEVFQTILDPRETVINGNDLDETITTQTTTSIVFGEGGNDTLLGQGGGDILLGGLDDDLLKGGDGADWLQGGSENDRLEGGAGNDNLDGEDGNDMLFGDHGADDLDGGAGSDTLEGGLDADTLNGGAGADQLRGGQGGDSYLLNDINGVALSRTYDAVVEFGNGGTDIVTVRSWAPGTLFAPTGYTLTAFVENGVIADIHAFNLFGNTDNNGLTGNEANNILRGHQGSDTLLGMGGADTLQGGVGDDRLEGGDGIDIADYGDAAGAVFVNLATLGSQAVGGGLGNDVLIETENLSGGRFGDALEGDAAANVLNGKGGEDYMAAGAGDDTYFVDTARDATVELAGGGTDSVFSGITHALRINIENLTLTGSSNINGSGNSAINTIAGNAGGNILNGLGGADIMSGGKGNDTYYLDTGLDLVFENANEGIDIMRVSNGGIAVLSSNVEKLYLLGVTITGIGNELSNFIYGNAAGNILDGREGADRMYGDRGDDEYIANSAGDLVFETTAGVAGGNDLVNSSVNYTLSTNVERLTLTGTGNVNGTGNVLANTIIGNAGNNFIDGKTGADILTGGLGGGNFVFTTALVGGNIDLITDYSVAADTLRIDNAVFAGLAAGYLAASDFRIGASAGDASDRIIYNSATGGLFFDADGLGGAAQVQFATLGAGLALTNADVFVF